MNQFLKYFFSIPLRKPFLSFFFAVFSSLSSFSSFSSSAAAYGGCSIACVSLPMKKLMNLGMTPPKTMVVRHTIIKTVLLMIDTSALVSSSL
jgi:hypothetical protein